MPNIRIFVSSPGDCSRERAVLDEVIARINQSDADRGGFFLKTYKWEEDVVPRLGPAPQAVVDDQTPRCDVYLGIMSSRFGGDDTRESGTEHEIRQALERFGTTGQPWVLFYFNDKPPVPQTEEAIRQWTKVVQFRKELEAKGIVGTYSRLRGSKNGFFEKVEQHLRLLLQRPEFALQQAAVGTPAPPAADVALDHGWITRQLESFKAQFAADMNIAQPLTVEAAEERYLDPLIAPASRQSPETLVAFETLAEEARPRWLIVGDEGTGKTIALNHLGMRAAERALEDASAPLPVYVRLTDFDTAQRPFARLMEIVGKAVGTDAVTAEQLCRTSARPLLFLLDGFSAIVPHFQIACVSALKELTRHDRHGIFLTSRPVNVISPLVGGHGGLNVGYITDLDDEQVHSYLARHAPGVTLAAFNERLDELGKTPFVLWALVAWHAQSADRPRNRAALCAYIVDDLIFQKREGRKLPPPTRYHYERVKKPVLARIGLEMAREGTVRRREEVAWLRQLRDQLVGLRNQFAEVGVLGEYELMPEPASPKGLIDELVENGVLRRRNGFLEFMNQLVRDYFAAVGALDLGTDVVLADTPALIWRFVDEPPDDSSLERGHSFWHPTVMLASLTADSSKLIEGISRKHPLLAAECLAAARSVSADLKADLEAEWSSMLTRADSRHRWMGCQCLGIARFDRDSIVKALVEAALGDGAYFVNIAAARALARIGPDRVASAVVAGAFDKGRQQDLRRDTRTANLIYRLSAPAVVRELFVVWRQPGRAVGDRLRAERFLASLKKGVVQAALEDIVAKPSAAGDEGIVDDARRCLQLFPSWHPRLGFPGFPVELFADAVTEIKRRSKQEQRAARLLVQALDGPALIEKLGDINHYVRSAAVARLSKVGSLAAAAPLVEAIRREPAMPAIDEMAVALVACARNRDTAVDLLLRALHGEERAFVCSIPGLSADERASFRAGVIPARIRVALTTAGRSAEGAVRVSNGGWMISAPRENPAPSNVPDDVFVEERDGQLAILALHARARLVRTLRFLPNESAVHELRRAAEHGDGVVRASALDALSRIPADRLPGEIFRSIGDPDPRARATAARAATPWPSDGTAEALGRQLLEEPDPRVASALIDAVGATRSRFGVTFLLDVLLAIRPSETGEREEAWSVKADWSGQIHRALVNLDLASHIQQLLLQRIDASGVGRAAAVAELGKWIKTEALGGSALASTERTARDLRLTQVALSDDDRLVRACAGGALRWSRVPEVVTTLKGELSSPIPERRAASARALGWLRDDAALDALRRSLEDDDVNVQLGAAEALGRLADDRSLKTAAEIAVRLALGQDMELRRAAGRAIDAIPGAYSLLLAPLIQSLEAQAFGDVIDLATVRVTARPDDARLLYIRGNALLVSGRADESLIDLQRSCNIDDGNPFAQEALARALLQAGRYAEALPHARFAVSQMPTATFALQRLGEAALFMGEYAEAIEALERSEQIEAGDAGTLLDLGLAHAGVGRGEDAHHAFDRFLNAFRRLTPEQSQESLTKIHAYFDKFLRAQPQMTGRLSALTHILETL